MLLGREPLCYTGSMAERFVNVDRQTPMLVPPDLRQWVPEDDLVHFVISAVDSMRLPSLQINEKGTGSAQYPPTMMMALLLYCYANGIFSSRRIERASWRDLAVRYLTGDTHPDHDTICAFRRANAAAVAEAFAELLSTGFGDGAGEGRHAERGWYAHSGQRQSAQERTL